MRCYELNRGVLLEGLPIAVRAGQAQVPLLPADMRLAPSSVPRLNVSDELSKRYDTFLQEEAFVVGARLKRCDIDKRADFWLVPETEETRNQVLVLCYAVEDDATRMRARRPYFEINGLGSQSHLTIQYNQWRKNGKGCLTLVSLTPGSTLSVVHFQNFLRAGRPKAEATVKVDSAGSLTATFWKAFL